MAHVPLNPIGNERDTFLDEQEVERNSAFIAELKATLTARRDEVATGWGDKYQPVSYTHLTLPTTPYV